MFPLWRRSHLLPSLPKTYLLIPVPKPSLKQVRLAITQLFPSAPWKNGPEVFFKRTREVWFAAASDKNSFPLPPVWGILSESKAHTNCRPRTCLQCSQGVSQPCRQPRLRCMPDPAPLHTRTARLRLVFVLEGTKPYFCLLGPAEGRVKEELHP